MNQTSDAMRLDREEVQLNGPSLNIAHQPIDSLRPNPENPRTHSIRQVRQIARSIGGVGFNVPVLIAIWALLYRTRRRCGP